jgi:hypothetical protein
LFSVILASMVTVAVGARAPRLVVNVVIDGLKEEYLDLLKDQFKNDGFNRLLKDGVVIGNVDFGSEMDRDAATALLMTGAAPSTNGIPGTTIFDKTTYSAQSVVADKDYVGNYTDRTCSPQRLKVTTLGDEARIAGATVTYVYSIAPDAEQAILMAGHAANSAVWIDDNSANWASTTYYKEFPNAAALSNRRSPLLTRLDTMAWTPSAATSSVQLPDHLKRYPFRYTFRRGDHDRVDAFKSSPLVNIEVTDLAKDYITTMNLGEHDGTDMLNIALTLTPYEYAKSAEARCELYDSYIKVDQCLARLFKVLDGRPGRDNVMVNVMGLPPRSTRRRDDDKWNIPGGEFSTRKAASLLNIYLTAIHGTGEWVKAVNSLRFYLNEPLIAQSQKDIHLMRQQAAQFLERMSGVNHAYTIDDIMDMTAATDCDPAALKRNTLHSEAGDIAITLSPGWGVIDDFGGSSKPTNQVRSIAPTTAPVMILCPALTPTKIGITVDARAVAPTIARQLHIRSPNGAEIAPLTF